MGERELRDAICEIGRRLHARGFVAAWDGNISARLPDGSFLCTPTMCSKGRLNADELCVVDEFGKQLRGPRSRTSEILLHLAIYRHRRDVEAVVHSHAPHATAFAVSGEPLPLGVLAEAEYFLGRVPTVPYTLPGTQAFADSVQPYLRETCRPDPRKSWGRHVWPLAGTGVGVHGDPGCLLPCFAFIGTDRPATTIDGRPNRGVG